MRARPDRADPRWPGSPGVALCPPTRAACRTADRYRLLRGSVPVTTCRTSLGFDATRAIFTSPVRPSNEMYSPSLTVLPLTRTVFRASSILELPAPTMDGFPICRPTTAAWEVIPPVAVRMPCDTNMPWMSSGTVSRRTRMTGLPCCVHSTASSAENTTCPLAAPGEAGSPLVAVESSSTPPDRSLARGVGSAPSGSTSRMASFGVTSFSARNRWQSRRRRTRCACRCGSAA